MNSTSTKGGAARSEPVDSAHDSTAKSARPTFGKRQTVWPLSPPGQPIAGAGKPHRVPRGMSPPLP